MRHDFRQLVCYVVTAVNYPFLQCGELVGRETRGRISSLQTCDRFVIVLRLPQVPLDSQAMKMFYPQQNCVWTEEILP